MKLESVEDFLKNHNFQGPVVDPIYRNDVVYWYRRVEGTTHQIIVKRWTLTRPAGQLSVSYDVEMTFESEFGIWAKTEFYGLNDHTLKVHLDRLAGRLVAAMSHLGADPVTYDQP